MTDAVENPHFLRNVVIKALALFVIANLALAAFHPGILGKISLYNSVLPGRERFPFGENPAKSYNLSLYNLDAMFASHEIAGGKKAPGEFRVVLLGDSSVWGTLLKPEQTLAGQLNQSGLACGSKTVKVYNLGYPTISLTKDIMLMRRALAYQPDLIVWPTTLEAFPKDKQTASPLAANNLDELKRLEAATGLKLTEGLQQPDFWQQTLIGQRRALADLFRLQMYGVMWAATGIDQEYPDKYPPAQLDYEADAAFHGWKGPDLPADGLAWDVLDAGMGMAQKAGVPVLLVNEPMLISSGKNSQIRYNFFYPKWAYDQYREALAERSRASGWEYLDVWDAVPAAEYTNSAIHLTPKGEGMLAQLVGKEIIKNCK